MLRWTQAPQPFTPHCRTLSCFQIGHLWLLPAVPLGRHVFGIKLTLERIVSFCSSPALSSFPSLHSLNIPCSSQRKVPSEGGKSVSWGQLLTHCQSLCQWDFSFKYLSRWCVRDHGHSIPERLGTITGKGSAAETLESCQLTRPQRSRPLRVDDWVSFIPELETHFLWAWHSYSGESYKTLQIFLIHFIWPLLMLNRHVDCWSRPCRENFLTHVVQSHSSFLQE